MPKASAKVSSISVLPSCMRLSWRECPRLPRCGLENENSPETFAPGLRSQNRVSRGDTRLRVSASVMPYSFVEACTRGRVRLRLIQEPYQLLAPTRLLQLADGFRLDLANPLAGDFENVADLFQRIAVAVA